MKALILLLTAMMLSAQTFAGTAPVSVKSTVDHDLQGWNSQEEALSIEKLCHFLRADNDHIKWGEKPAKLTCTKMTGGLVEINAENSLGQLSIFANASDMTVVDVSEGDYTYEYTNNLHQRLYLQLSFKHVGLMHKIFGFGQAGFYAAELSLYDSGTSRIRMGYETQDYRP